MNIYGFYCSFQLDYERKEEKHAFWSLIVSFESLMDITKNVPSLGSLIAFIGINNLLRMKTRI